jgi:nitroreductase
MTFEEIVHHRRSTRIYKNQDIDIETVKQCLELAALSPNSSNMQLWEFYHITQPELLQKLSTACFSQQAATTARQMVVFVTRQDLHRKRSRKMMELETANVQRNSPPEKLAHRTKRWKMYYGYVIPFLYTRFWGLAGLVRKVMVNVLGLFRPIYYQVSEGDMRVVVHKTCALAAQTFMLAMSSKGYDTCPMEGFDSRRVKKLLKLPFGAEVNMIVSCGIRDEKGIWGERMRVPFDEVYKTVG